MSNESPSPRGGSTACPLCGASDTRPLHPGYVICPTCGLAHLLPAHHPTAAAELAHYRTHENDPRDPRYRRFLDHLAEPMTRRVPPPAHGLDFGSGPGPTLSVMLAERGYTMCNYDPCFAPDAGALQKRYDLITCSETVEHFRDPAAEFARLDRLLEPGGWLGVMTQMFDADDPSFHFGEWWYRRDPTHLCFYQRRTMRWIARRLGWRVTFEGRGDRVALFQAPRDSR